MTRAAGLFGTGLFAAIVLLYPFPTGAYQDGIFDCATMRTACIPAGRSFESCGSPGCHGGLFPPITTHPLLEGLPTDAGYVPGETYTLAVTVLGTSVPIPVTGCPSVITVYNGLNALFGFNLEVDGGRFAPTTAGDEMLRILNETECARLRRLTGCGVGFAPPCPPCDDETVVSAQATHTLLGNRQFQWTLVWSAPEAGTGDVRFHLAGNAVNGNCRPDSGDLYGVMSEIVVGEKPGT